MHTRWVRVSVAAGCVAVLVQVAGCGDGAAGGDGTATVKCGSGTLLDPATKSCVVPDAGALGDGGTVTGADGATTGADGAATPGKDGAVAVNDSGGDSGTPASADAVLVPDIALPTCDPGAAPADQWWNCAPKKAAAAGPHGKKCAKDEDCAYGRCMFGLPHAGYDKAIGICTKNCGYPSGGMMTACESDNAAGATYKCTFEGTHPKAGGKNEKRDEAQVPFQRVYKACLRVCKADSDCAAWNAELPTCLKTSTNYIKVGTEGVCIKNP
ncbi:MAG: hypothetical protein EXR79_07250 [Myxococcales bacterium]|nr:hypothetical protein [Myxococcales bacterium]